VGVWPNFQCVPISNSDGTDNVFGRNQSTTVDTVAVRATNISINRYSYILKARSAEQKRQRESPGYDHGHEFREWMASHGDVAGTPRGKSPRVHGRVTFDDKDEAFADVEETEVPNPIPLNPSEETVNNEWGVDGEDSPHPSTEHRERYTWQAAPSRRLINLTAGRHRESYDLDLLAFQAGSYASDEEETDYLESDIDGQLIKGVQLQMPEEDHDATKSTDETPGQAPTTIPIDAEDLANEPDGTESPTQPQAAIDTYEHTCVIESAPEFDIEIEFGEEHIIELSSYY